MKDELDLVSKSHVRIGYVSRGDGGLTDAAVEAALARFPPDAVLPPRWAHKGPQAFVEAYGRGKVWARTASFHLLLIDGVHVLRLWTDTTKRCIVDLHNDLAELVSRVEAVPASALRKTKPFTKRVYLDNLQDLEKVLTLATYLWPT